MASVYKILEANKTKLINSEICSECKGACCKKTPCSYLPRDLDMSKKGLMKKLENGEATITSNVTIGYLDNQFVSVPTLMVEARSVTAGPIDLMSPKAGCSLLSSEGCTLKEKPSGALLLIPGEGGLYGNDETRCKNLIDGNGELLINEWLKHERVLLEIVEKVSDEKFELLYAREILRAAQNIIQKGQNLSYNEMEVAELLDIMGVFYLEESLHKEQRLENPTPNHLNILRPDKVLTRKLI